MNITAWNAAPSHQNYDVRFNVISAITDMKISIVTGNVFRRNESVVFAVDVDHVGSESCVLVDFNEIHNSLPINYLDQQVLGNITSCRRAGVNLTNVPVRPITRRNILLRDYIYVGNYLVHARAFDYFGELSDTQTFIVSYGDCEQPEAWILEGHPHVIKRSETVQYRARNVIHCHATQQYIQQWRVYDDGDGGSVYDIGKNELASNLN